MLRIEGLTKIFGGLRAVDNASLKVDAGQIVALIGPNGAGKTTLFASIAGFHKINAGRVEFLGQDITGRPVHEIARLGMVRTFQITQPFAKLSVLENIMVGAYQQFEDRALAEAHAREVAQKVGMAAILDQPASELTVAARKRLELARALATGPKLLLLDEVMAGHYISENNKHFKIICIGGSVSIACGDEKEVPRILYNFEFIWRLRYETRRRLIRLINTFFYYLIGRYINKSLKNLKIIYEI